MRAETHDGTLERSERARLSAAELRRHCLELPGAVEEFPVNDPEASVFKVGGKVFAITKLSSRPLKVSVKCDPERAHDLRSEHRAVEPGYHLDKRHWITVDTEGDVTRGLVHELIEDSNDLVRPASATQTSNVEGERPRED